MKIDYKDIIYTFLCYAGAIFLLEKGCNFADKHLKVKTFFIQKTNIVYYVKEVYHTNEITNYIEGIKWSTIIMTNNSIIMTNKLKTNFWLAE